MIKFWVNPRTWRKRRACLKSFRAYPFGEYGALLSLLSENYQETRVDTSQVTFKPLDDSLIKAYFSLVNPLDKAGGYAIQTVPI